MELRQLRYFLVVADELHFGRAAERLHITQPPLTVAVKRLERELGVQLFDRTTRRVTLTAAGQAFRDRIQAAVAELDDAAGDVADVAAGMSGKIRVGFVSSASYTTVPEAIRAFRQQRPRVDLCCIRSPAGSRSSSCWTETWTWGSSGIRVTSRG